MQCSITFDLCRPSGLLISWGKVKGLMAFHAILGGWGGAGPSVTKVGGAIPRPHCQEASVSAPLIFSLTTYYCKARRLCVREGGVYLQHYWGMIKYTWLPTQKNTEFPPLLILIIIIPDQGEWHINVHKCA
jgi:hypothetical protein